jgi:predicted RNA-binding Zn-ribbon protein involved in translation (DUF1610 family)
MPYQFEETIVLETLTCSSCGITFALPARFIQERREHGTSFFCPNGHERVFRDPEVKVLQKKLEQAQRQTEQYKGWYKAEQNDHEHTRKRLSATKGVLTKTKKRVAAGVCPVCRRSFADLHRHMHGQHPNYAEQDDD